MTEPPVDQFEVIGDPDDLPDAFFEALAGLLIAIDQSKKSQPKVEEEHL